jgi:hypothetical protein
VRFELTEPFGSLVFKTSTIDHSVTLPKLIYNVMHTIKKIIESPILEEPWYSKIVDNFLEEDLFNQLRNECERIFSSRSINNFSEPTTRLNELMVSSEFSESLSQSLLDLNSSMLKNIDSILDSFPYSRRFKYYHSIPSFFFLRKGTPDHPIHDESHYKSLSIVLYISPNISSGTKLYTPAKSFHNQVEWKPNRAFIFCGKSKHTWHTFGGSESNDRITMNLFIQDDFYSNSIDEGDSFRMHIPGGKILSTPKTPEILLFADLLDKGLTTTKRSSQ